MNFLRRELAPISPIAWREIDEEARGVLGLHLAARKLVDFHGPLGWDAGAVNTGRNEALKAGPATGVTAARRQVMPLLELRASFTLSRTELDGIDRGAKDADLAPVTEAATRLAHAEDTAVFHGYAAGCVRGIADAAAHPVLSIAANYEEYPRTVAEATRLLREAGVNGPYGIALGARCYTGLLEATARGGFPVIKLVEQIIEGPLVWAPAVDGAVVLSTRGGDFELTVGQDLSIGYAGHDDVSVRLHLIETMAFRVLTPEAAVVLTHRSAGQGRKAKRG